MRMIYLLLAGMIFLTPAVHAHEAKVNDTAKKSAKIDMLKIAGPLGPFAAKDSFPKSYFLIPNNLPFMAGLTLGHPMSHKLNLTAEQKKLIQQVKQHVVPLVLPLAKKAKTLELKLADLVIKDEPMDKLVKLVDEIADVRANLTKEQLHCIKKIRDILTKQQYEILLTYANK